MKYNTANEFITNHKKPGGYAFGDIISFQGYTSKGDGGDAKWKAKGTQGTASQTPLLNNLPELSDADGNEFELADKFINILALGGSTEAHAKIANTAGLTTREGVSDSSSIEFSAAITADNSNRGKILLFTGASTVDVAIDTASTKGATWIVMNDGSANINVTSVDSMRYFDGSVVVTAASIVVGQGGVATINKRTDSSVVIWGIGLS